MNEEIECITYWMCFSKTGPIRFISHLDLTRAFHRAFFRAGIRMKTSSGFTPHPKFAFALPLSVGMESLSEYAVFTLAEGVTLSPEEVKERLSRQMPKGVEILSVEPPRGKFSQIAAARYEVRLPRMARLCFAANRLFQSGEITVEKRTKKGDTVSKNVAGSVKLAQCTTDGEDLVILATLAASGEDYLNPDLLVQALQKAAPEDPIEEKRITRLAVLTAEGKEI